MVNKKIICPKCKKANVVRRGYFQTKIHGKQQRYFCKNCNKKFVEQTPFYRMRNHEKKITLCLDLFFKGVSTREIQSHLSAFYPHNCDHSTILRWIRRYSLQIAKFTDKLKIKASKEMQTDEMEFKTKGNQSWFIDCVDVRTRYMVSSDFVKSRGENELKSVLRNAKNKTEKQIQVITTDGLLAYPNVIKKTFGLRKNNRYFGVIHNQVNASRGEGFNIIIERMHNTIRARTKTFRGFKNVESAKAIMKGFEVYYNFIRKHQSLKGKTPSQLATNIELKTPNKWLELIKLSNTNNLK